MKNHPCTYSVCRGGFLNRNKKAGANFSNRKLLAIIILFLLAVGGCFLFTWLFLLLAAKLLCAVDLSESLHIPIASGCCSVAVFLISMVVAQKIRKHSIVWGAVIAAGTYCTSFLAGLLQGNTVSRLSFFRALLYLCCGMLGGALGMLLSERRKLRK